jgi:hypothetical protein
MPALLFLVSPKKVSPNLRNGAVLFFAFSPTRWHRHTGTASAAEALAGRS